MNQARVKAAWQGHGLEVSPGWPVAYNQAPSVFGFGHLRNKNRNMSVKRFILKAPSITLKHSSFMLCTTYSWVPPVSTFRSCFFFSRKFQDGRVEGNADFLTPLSLQGMSRIENNWGCLAQIGEIATTFGIVALWPHTCTFQLKRVAEQISEDSSRGFAARNAGRVGWKSEFWLVYTAHSCCCLCIASGIQNCIIHKSFQPIRASWGMHMSSNQNATAYIP